MDHLIEQFLFSQQYCPIPGVGTLHLKMKTPIAHFGENKMVAPVPYIHLDDEIRKAEFFIKFIESRLGIEKEAATNLLDDISLRINQIESNASFSVGQIGAFSKDEAGKLVFVSSELPAYLLPTVKLNRVVHPNATHSVRVGDQEHTNQFMSELLSEKEITQKDKWWIAAAVILFIGLMGFFYSLFFSANKNKWSNQISISISSEPKNYQYIP